MIESFINYFGAFKKFSDENSERKLSYFELMGLSWGLHIVYAIYSVFALFLGVKSYAYLTHSKDFTHIILDAFSFKFQKLSYLLLYFPLFSILSSFSLLINSGKGVLSFMPIFLNTKISTWKKKRMIF